MMENKFKLHDLQEFWDNSVHLRNCRKMWANASVSWLITCAPFTVRELSSNFSNI